MHASLLQLAHAAVNLLHIHFSLMYTVTLLRGSELLSVSYCCLRLSQTKSGDSFTYNTVYFTSQSKTEPFAQGEYNVYSTFQSHEPEFDYLKSLEIEEKINKIRWLPQQNAAHFLLSTNGEKLLPHPPCRMNHVCFHRWPLTDNMKSFEVLFLFLPCFNSQGRTFKTFVYRACRASILLWRGCYKCGLYSQEM